MLEAGFLSYGVELVLFFGTKRAGINLSKADDVEIAFFDKFSLLLVFIFLEALEFGPPNLPSALYPPRVEALYRALP